MLGLGVVWGGARVLLGLLVMSTSAVCHPVINPFNYSFNQYFLIHSISIYWVLVLCQALVLGAGNKDGNKLPFPSKGLLPGKCSLCIICHIM